MYVNVCVCVYVCIITPLFSIEEGKDVLAGHKAFLHIAQLQVVHLQHVLLLLLLQEAKEKHAGQTCEGEKERDFGLRLKTVIEIYSICTDTAYQTKMGEKKEAEVAL